MAYNGALFLCLFILSSFHFTVSLSSGFSLKLIPGNSPDSPLYPGNLTQHQIIQRLVQFSKARANYLHSTFSLNTTLNPDNIQLPVHKHGFYFAVEVSLGTPRSSQKLVMDTGSGLMWTQCNPCLNCFNQLYPIYNSTASRSYQKLSCNHRICRQLYRCVNNECVYELRYAGNERTRGVVSVETFQLPFSNRVTRSLQNVIFGCSKDNQGFIFASTQRIAGILGLSSSPDSFASQLSRITQGRFSYCVPYHQRPMTTNGLLRFGEDIRFRNPSNVRRTKFLQQNIGYHYFLNLVDISIAGHRLGFPPGTFALKPDGTGGCVIDSGSVISHIDQGPYRVVMREFEMHFLRFGLERVQNAVEDLELCYRNKPNFRQYIGMTFHFQDTNFVVESNYMYVHNDNERYFCVALRPFAGKTFLGSWQQQNTRFVYDLNARELLFAPEDCSLDRA